MPQKLKNFILFLFFLSGFTGLSYEILWLKRLGLIFGVSAYATSTILIIFFSGLALGSFLFGKIADKSKNLIRQYALLESGISFYALGTPWFFKFISGLGQKFAYSYQGFDFATAAMALLFLIIPTILMGATLPVISRLLAKENAAGQAFSLSYSTNTLGGALGVLISALFLLPQLGWIKSLYVIVLINGLIAIAAFIASRFLNFEPENLEIKSQKFSKKTDLMPKTQNYLLIIAFFTGCAALALEVLLSRALILVLGSSIYAITITFFTFILGIALGAGFIQKSIDRLKHNIFMLGLSLFSTGITVLFLIPTFNGLPFLFLKFFAKWQQNINLIFFSQFIISGLILLVPTFLMGISLPLIVRAYVQNDQQEKFGKNIGKIYSINTAGGILGSFISGFLFLPKFGLYKSLIISAFLYIAAMLILSFKQPKRDGIKIFVLLIAIFLIFIGFKLPKWNQKIITSGVSVYAPSYINLNQRELKQQLGSGELLYFKDGLLSTITVTKFGNILSLKINGKADASNAGDQDTQILLGQIPMQINPESKNALVIGLGSGITAGQLSQYPLQNIDVVEIEPAVPAAARFFEKENHQALSDKRVKIIIDDARSYLNKTQKKYDLIVSEPSTPWISGISNLFTKEYFETTKNHLTHNGLMVQWLPLAQLSLPEVKTILATFKNVFPYLQIWDTFQVADLILVGSTQNSKIDYQTLPHNFSSPQVTQNMNNIYIKNPAQFLSYFVTANLTDAALSGAPIQTDDKITLEYSAPKSLYNQKAIIENLEFILGLRENPLAITENCQNQDCQNKISKLFEFRNYAQKAKIYLDKTHLNLNLENLNQTIENLEKALALNPEYLPFKEGLLLLRAQKNKLFPK